MTHPDGQRADDPDARPAADVQVRGKTADIEAVRGVDLRVGAGEIFGFLGPNGAGKTTTLRMLATLLTPTSGEATVAGADLRREPQLVRERIGYVPQGGSTDPAETGRGELVIQGRLYGMNKTQAARRRAGEVLACARPRVGRRSGDGHLFRRHEAPARRRPRHRPSAGGPVPRRADHRSRPAGAGPDVGRDPGPPRARGPRSS